MLPWLNFLGGAHEVDIAEVPNELPILPLRNIVGFPFVVVPLAVGIPRSVKLVEEAAEGNRLIGLVAMIAGMVLTGGVALGVILTLYGISALVWIATGDAQAFKAQWESGEFKKRDKWILITSVVLSVVAVGSLIAMSVLSGGAPIYLCSLILVAAWLVTNGRALYCLYQREVRPWEYAAVITPEHFRKLTQTEASEEQIEQVLNQMEPIHQKGIRERFTNWKKAALNWEEEMKRRQEVGFARLLERIEQARSVALRSVA